MKNFRMLRPVFSLSVFLALLISLTASAEGLFPSMNQLFDIAMPSIGVALGYDASETGENENGKYEVYSGFSYDDYTAFGAYLAGIDAILTDITMTDSTITVTLSARDASMQFIYNWEAQTATAVYPSGTWAETEKQAVKTKESILPLIENRVPMFSFGEALCRYPDEEKSDANGDKTEIFKNVTEADFNTFSVYLSDRGAKLADYQVIDSSFSASIQMKGKVIGFTYDKKTLEARVTYPKDTYDEWLNYAMTQFKSVIQQLDEGKTDDAMSVLFTIPNYSRYWPVAEYLEAHPDFATKAAAVHEAKVAPYRTVGGYVTFGHYEQDNDYGNGYEAIEWIVLDYDEANNRALLISRYGLFPRPYNMGVNSITWEKCTLRIWLNSFQNAVFNATEKTGILISEVDNSKNQGYSGWDTDGGNNTYDRLFLLSYAEANQYFDVTKENKSNIRSRVAPTAYAIARGAYFSTIQKTAAGEDAGWWWLRSPGDSQYGVACVTNDGSLSNGTASFEDGVVRPAFWLNLDSGIF